MKKYTSYYIKNIYFSYTDDKYKTLSKMMHYNKNNLFNYKFFKYLISYHKIN